MRRCSCASMPAAQEPSDDENDMLDLAFGLTRTSRLGCQVIADKSLDGIVVRLPAVCRPDKRRAADRVLPVMSDGHRYF